MSLVTSTTGALLCCISSSQNPVIDALTVRENAVETIELVRILRAARRIINHQTHGAAESGGDTLGDDFRAGKHLRQAAMDPAGIGSALGLLGFEPIQLSQHIHGDAEVVFLETFERSGVMEQHVGVQNIVFHQLRGGGEAEIRRFRRITSASALFRDSVVFRVLFKQCALCLVGAMDHGFVGGKQGDGAGVWERDAGPLPACAVPSRGSESRTLLIKIT